MIILDNEYMRVEYLENLKFLYHKRMGIPESKTYREMLTQILNLVVSEKVKYWLYDASESERVQGPDESWVMELLENYYNLIAIEKFALVLPPDVFNLLTAESIIAHIQKRVSFELQYFNEKNSAEEWLEESFREICFTEDNLDLEYNRCHNWIYADWKGYHTFSSVRRGCELIHDLIEAKGCSKLFNDNRFALGDWQDATQWIVTDWMPRMDNIGLSAAAWVLSPSGIHRATAQEIFISMKTQTQIQIFNDYYSAKNWLKAV